MCGPHPHHLFKVCGCPHPHYIRTVKKDQFYPILSKNFQKKFLDKTEITWEPILLRGNCVGVNIFDLWVWCVHRILLQTTDFIKQFQKKVCIMWSEKETTNFKFLARCVPLATRKWCNPKQAEVVLCKVS